MNIVLSENGTDSFDKQTVTRSNKSHSGNFYDNPNLFLIYEIGKAAMKIKGKYRLKKRQNIQNNNVTHRITTSMKKTKDRPQPLLPPFCRLFLSFQPHYPNATPTDRMMIVFPSFPLMEFYSFPVSESPPAQV